MRRRQFPAHTCSLPPARRSQLIPERLAALTKPRLLFWPPLWPQWGIRSTSGSLPFRYSTQEGQNNILSASGYFSHRRDDLLPAFITVLQQGLRLRDSVGVEHSRFPFRNKTPSCSIKKVRPQKLTKAAGKRRNSCQGFGLPARRHAASKSNTHEDPFLPSSSRPHSFSGLRFLSVLCNRTDMRLNAVLNYTFNNRLHGSFPIAEW